MHDAKTLYAFLQKLCGIRSLIFNTVIVYIEKSAEC